MGSNRRYALWIHHAGAVITAAAAATVLGSAATGQGPGSPALPEPARSLLVRDMGLSPGDIRKIEGDEVVSLSVKTRDPREVAALGSVRIAVSKEEFFARYRDIERFKQHEAVKALGRFSSPPNLEDVLRLNFDDDTLGDLRKCRPGDCKVKLPASIITRLHRDIDWRSEGWREEAEAVLHQELVGLVATYMIMGEPALVTYADKRKPDRLADEFRGLVASSPYLGRLSPALTLHLLRYPLVSRSDVESLIYWSKESFGLKPVVSITHVSIHQPPAHPHVMVGASKQIYASHYFLASLGLTIAIDVPSRDHTPSILLLYINRTRVDNLQGFLSGLRRSIVRGRTEDGVAETLRDLKQRLESDGRQPEAPRGRPTTPATP